MLCVNHAIQVLDKNKNLLFLELGNLKDMIKDQDITRL